MVDYFGLKKIGRFLPRTEIKIFLFTGMVLLISTLAPPSLAADKCRQSIFAFEQTNRVIAPFLGINSATARLGKISSKKMFETVRKSDGSFEFIPIHRGSWKLHTYFSSANSPYAPDGSPHLFGYENENASDIFPSSLGDKMRFLFNRSLKNTKPMVPQIIFDFLGVTVDQKTMIIHVPSIETINKRLDEIEQITGLKLMHFYESSNQNYLDGFTQLRLPFNEPLHDFFGHFDVIFENTEKFQFLQKTVMQLKSFFANNSAERIGISKANYDFLKKQMELYLAITIDNSCGLNLSLPRSFFMQGQNLFAPLKSLNNGSGEQLLQKVFGFTSPYDRSLESRNNSADVLGSLVIHAITFGRSYTQDPSSQLEYPPMSVSSPFKPPAEFMLFADYFAQELKSYEHAPPPDLDKMKSSREIRDQIAEALLNRP